ncbi:MAG: hypothetical protein KKA84_13615 [Bacteroidetes bacterium]|nr:hypothetical protein [Bacteroidota bacterium]
MKYRNKQECLFTAWQKEIPEYKDNFIKDGIVNEELYFQSNPKILFLMKEANDSDGGEGSIVEFMDSHLKYTFFIRIAEWVYAIQNNFSRLLKVEENRKELHQALRSIALIDVKKSCGGSKSDSGIIRDHVQKNKHFLQKQIELINPDLIISGLGDLNLLNTFMNDVSWIRTQYGKCIGRWDKFKVIDFSHPSNRFGSAMNYCLLKAIMESNEFKNL